MVTESRRLTWEGLFVAFKHAFLHLTAEHARSKDHWWVWKRDTYMPNPDRTLGYFYCFALVEVTIRNRAWHNLWRGEERTNTWLELIRPDWDGAGHEVNVDPRHEIEIAPKLVDIERDCGCKLIIKTSP